MGIERCKFQVWVRPSDATVRSQGLLRLNSAKKTGFDPKTISRFETGTYTPSVEALFLLADVLGVKLKAFFSQIWKTKMNSGHTCSASYTKPPRRIWES